MDRWPSASFIRFVLTAIKSKLWTKRRPSMQSHSWKAISQSCWAKKFTIYTIWLHNMIRRQFCVISCTYILILIAWRDAGVGDMGVICLVVLVTVINDTPSWSGALVGVGLGKWFRLIRWLMKPSYDSLKVQWSDCWGEWWARWELHFELSTSQFISNVWERTTELFVYVYYIHTRGI